MHSPERTCYYINRSDNATITHHSIQKQRTTAKELSRDSFKCLCKRTSLFHDSCLLISRTNLSENECYWCLCPYIAARNTRELQAGYLLANGTRSMCFPIHFYTNACVLISFLTFYDIKLQLVKSCHRG